MPVYPPTPYQEDFLTRINEVHVGSGRTLREAATRSIIDHTYLHLILHGKRKPSRDVLICLCWGGWNLDIYDTDELLRLGGYETLIDWSKAGWEESTRVNNIRK